MDMLVCLNSTCYLFHPVLPVLRILTLSLNAIRQTILRVQKAICDFNALIYYLLLLTLRNLLPLKLKSASSSPQQIEEHFYSRIVIILLFVFFCHHKYVNRTRR
jgi:hypothetical protein